MLTLLMLIFCVGLPLYVGDHRPHRVLLYHIRLPDVDRLKKGAGLSNVDGGAEVKQESLGEHQSEVTADYELEKYVE